MALFTLLCAIHTTQIATHHARVHANLSVSATLAKPMFDNVVGALEPAVFAQ